MGYKRHIIAESLPVQVFSLAIDETRAVFRLLAPVEAYESRLSPAAREGSLDELRTTARLADRSPLRFYDKFYVVNGGRYVIQCEAIIDKTKPEFKRIWWPGMHLVVWLDSHAQRIRIDNKGGLTHWDMRNTAEISRHMGGLWLFDMWVRNPDAPVTDMARSITTTRDSVVITNVDDLGEEWPAETVMKGGASKWLSIDYELTPERAFVAPDGWVNFTLRILDGKTKELASDVSWHNYIVEPVDGYCPHRRVAVRNGVGTFRMKAMDLLPGETMRVKVGTRHGSRCDASVSVVAQE